MKKGQITLFIIIGIIILITLGLLFYFTSIKEKSLEEERMTTPMQLREGEPVSDLVTSCLKQTAINGLKLIGDQGGYTKPEFQINQIYSTEGNAVSLGENGIKIPKWWYMQSPDKCKQDCDFDSKKPLLYSSSKINIEEQLEEYIEENIAVCLGDFNILTTQGFEIEKKGNPNADIKIRDADVQVFMDWRIKVSKGTDQYEIENYNSEITLNIKEIYELAEELTNMQMTHAYIEEAIRQLIYGFARLSKYGLPPISDTEFKFGGEKYWTKTEVKKKITQMLQTYIPFIQVSGVRNYNYVAAAGNINDPELFELIYNRQFLIPLNSTHSDLEIRFYYLDWWKPYFDLNCDGEICKPDSSGLDQSFGFIIGLQKYKFLYDISIPVMVEITNPESFDGEGYSFKFMLEANMRSNQAFKSETELPSELLETGLSMFCSPNQMNSGDITIDIKDYVTGEYIEGATITYRCGDNACGIGSTENKPATFKFPRCLNGELSIRKQGYMPFYVPFTAEDSDITMQIKMYSEQELTIIPRRYNFIKEGLNWKLDTTKYYPREETGSLMIAFTKIPRDYEDSYSSIVDLSNDNKIKLIPGKYKIMINGFTKEEITIPVEQRCTDPQRILGITIVKKKCYYIPEEPLIFDERNPFPNVMVELEIEIPAEKLYTSKEILLNYISAQIAKVPEEERKIEDLSVINDMKEYAFARQDIMRPVFR